MRLVARIDDSALEPWLKAFLKNSKRDAKEVIKKDAVGGMAVWGLKLTPPTVGKGDIGRSFAAQKKAGEQAIERDLLKMFFPVSARSRSRQSPNAEYRFVKKAKGNVYLCKPTYDKRTSQVAQLESLHLRNRDKRGRVRWKKNSVLEIGQSTFNVQRYVVDSVVFAEYLKKVKARLGQGKAGWLGVIRQSGRKTAIPNWISRHESGSKVKYRFDEDDKASKYYVTFGNLVDHIQGPGEAANVMENAYKYTVNSFRRQVENLMAKNIAKANAK